MALFKQKKAITSVWIAAAAFVVMVGVNALANVLPINGVTTGEVSDTYDNLFVPAGVTFSIWGLIYSLLAVYCLYRIGILFSAKRRVKGDTIEKTDRYFIVSSLLNTAWILAWHYTVLWLSVILIVGILYCLIKIALLLHRQKYSLKEFIAVKLPFSIYFGWITVATIANITALLVSLQWDGAKISDGAWAVALLLVGAAIGLVVAVRHRDWAYLAVFVWAYAGILVNHLAEFGWNGMYPSVIVALTVLLAVLISCVISLFIQWPTGRHSKSLLDSTK